MIILCFRCSKPIDTPNGGNADYIIASDTMVVEPREVLLALKHNQNTLEKKTKMAEMETYFAEDGSTELTRPKYPGLVVDDDEYDAIEIPDFGASKSIGENLVKVIAVIRDKGIQKTGIVCPSCLKDTDFIIWGVHKRHEEEVSNE